MTMSETDQTKAAKKGGKGKLFIIIGLVVVLLGGGGAAAYFTMRKPAADAKDEHAKDKKEHDEEEKKVGTGIVGFEPFVVNLADKNAPRFLRINVRLIVGEAEEAKHIEENQVLVMRLRSAILEILTAQTSEHIVTPEGKAELKKTIAEQSSHILEHVEVTDVLFSDFVVQY